ncbi:MAG: hypothetical protein WCG84_01885 [Candidatus Moraniibacteriota bacterium]
MKSFHFTDKSLLIFFVASFVAAGFVLAFASQRALDLNTNKNWWTVSFANPTDATLTFGIANHSPTTSFSYTLTSSNGKKTDTVSVNIPTGNTQTVEPVTPDGFVAPFRASVQHDGMTQEIYKN